MKGLELGLISLSPDNFQIIGPMKLYPNIILNVGYGS